MGSRANQLARFDITPEQWDKMYSLQKGLCPICGKRLHRPGNKDGKRAAAVDHDHSSMVVRGLTCLACNRWKIAKNTAESARKVLEYLESGFDGREL